MKESYETQIEKSAVHEHEHKVNGDATPGSGISQEAPLNDEMPTEYFWTPQFIGALLSGSLGLFGGTGSFALVAPILRVVNEDIGPDRNYVWIGLVNTLMLAVGLNLVGRLSDIFGRRWFVVSGNFLGLIGCIVASQARSIPTLIGANVIIGASASVQTSVPFIFGELVEMKYRYVVSAGLYLFAIPTAAFGPAISYGFILGTKAGWRWCYYICIIANALSTLGYFIFYHPPTFEMLNQKTRWQKIKELDFGGLFLFVGGLVVFILGLNWGGTVYPWDSSYVIGTLVAGGVGLIAFVLYECYMPLAQPLVPMHLFKNFPWVANVLVVALAASVYYGFSIVWPLMVFGVYTTDQREGSYLCLAVTASFMLGVISAGLSRHIGKQKIQIVTCCIIFMPLLGAIACSTVDNQSTVLGLLITGCIFVGYVEGCSVTSTSISVHDQAEIGTAVGISSTIRALTATIATTIYVVILNNRLTTTVPQKVLPALVQTNLPPSSYVSFIGAFSTGAFSSVEGATPDIIAVGTAAYKQALVLAFRTVFFASIAFSGLTLIFAIFFPNLDAKMTKEVARTLHASSFTPKWGRTEKNSHDVSA